MQGQATTHINANPETVYRLVADITNMGRWSPECTGCEWVSDARGVGAAFTGHNKLGPFKWSTTPTVTVDDHGKAFAFATGATEWRYDFEAVDGGTKLTESFTVGLTGIKVAVAKIVGRDAAIKRGMAKTVAKIKAAAENQR